MSTLSSRESGCYTGLGQHSSKFNNIHLEMSKADVIGAIGNLQSTSTKSSVEYMTHNVYEVVFGTYVPYFF
jgi:hypothetical protein